MRMRQLGHGQSVMFFAPLEVDRSIRKAANKNSSDRVERLGYFAMDYAGNM